MQHTFDIDFATEYGMVEAVLFSHLEYWIKKNEANNKNFFDGRYWTYNSIKAWCKMFPYLSDNKIRNALKHLEAEGLVLTGNYNKSAYDRTLWYAFTDKAISILQKRKMEFSESKNQNCENEEPIPDRVPSIETDRVPDNSTQSPKMDKRKDGEDFESFWSAYPKKKNKEGARKAFAKVKVPLQVLLDAIERQKKSKDWLKDGGQYIPYPSTWLNNGAWEDEAEPAQGKWEYDYSAWGEKDDDIFVLGGEDV